ncbi:MAG: hypothetical protein WC614_13205 [bacterium]
MSINYITLQDIQKGTHEANRMVIIHCKNCKDQKIGNHIDWVKDCIKAPGHYFLHRCPVCRAETKLKKTDIKKIKEVLGGG